MSDDKKDPGMKWVIFANVLLVVIMALLVTASYFEKIASKNKKQEIDNIEKVESVSSLDDYKNYDFDLKITPQNCEGVSGDVDIVLITDANYMDFTRVAINSAKKTKCPESVYNFHVMTIALKDGDKEALESLKEENVNVRVLEQKQIDLFYIRDTHVSKASLLKYYIAEQLPELNKALYVDSDILVLHDLNELYKINLGDNYLAVVKDPSWFFENGHVLELNLDERGFYFNSGVMLMNLDKIRKDGIIQKLEDYTNNNFRTYMDQDAFNVVVGDKAQLMDVKFNTMNFFFAHNPISKLAEFYGKDWNSYEDVFSGATIIHFASSKKPLGIKVEKTDFFYMLQKLWYKYYTPLPKLS